MYWWKSEPANCSAVFFAAPDHFGVSLVSGTGKLVNVSAAFSGAATYAKRLVVTVGDTDDLCIVTAGVPLETEAVFIAVTVIIAAQ
mgnify:CR=1 FL=1